MRRDRLGVFGFFGHPGPQGSGTYGLKDQQAALSWVDRGITGFGGGTRTVTFASQSAGGVSGCAQLTSPGAKGLFGKAILQCGSCSPGGLENFDYRNQKAVSSSYSGSSTRSPPRRGGTRR